MRFFSKTFKLWLVVAVLYGSGVFAKEYIASAEPSAFDSISFNQMNALNPDLLLCKNLTKLKKTNLFSGLNNPKTTQEFYANYCKNSQTLAWNSSLFELSHQARELISSIEASYDEGLNPHKYHLDALLAFAQSMSSSNASKTVEQQHNSLIRADILLTDAYVTLAQDLYYGFTDWKKFKNSKKEKRKKLAKDTQNDKNKKEDVIEWDRASKTPIYPAKELIGNLALNKIAGSLYILSPNSDEYRLLVQSLKHYRTLHAKGGWQEIPSGPTIRIDQSDVRVPLIKKRLVISGDLNEIENYGSQIYNEPKFIEAVKSFQRQHNLEADGLIGQKTINALNISSSTKVSKIILNLERHRWLSHGMDDYPSYININIPAFQMQVFEHGKEVMKMKVIVGKKKRPTPILNSKISYAVLNPSWTAPTTIVKEDILQKGSIDEYLQSHNMKIYSNVGGETTEINPDDINWSHYKDKEYVPYTFKADSGEANPLGLIKFMFNNKYSVYMHDTNQRYLFKNEYRALSSGCLRLNDPMKLLNYLLEKKGIIDAQDNVDVKKSDKIVSIKKKIPVVIRYMTVKVESDKHTYFYDDIYGYDTLLRESIKDNSWML